MRLLRLLPVLPLLAGLSAVGAVTAVGPSALGCASAASAHHAALVIEHGNGASLRYCIGFDTAQVSGQYLLDASGVEKAEQGYGSIGQAVCQIDYEPPQYPSGCWTASSPYWAMFVSRGGGGWGQSSLGVSSQTFHDGDAEGFRYEGQSAYLTPPSSVGICPAPAPPPTAAPTPRSTPRSTSTPTAHQSSPATVGPGRTATPTAVALATAPPGGATAGATARPSSSATPDVVVVGGSPASTPPSSSTPGSGLIAAAALAAAMVGLLTVQVIRERGRRRTASSKR